MSFGNFETLLFEEKENIGILKINRPKALNALNAQVLAELDRFLDEAEKSATLRCLILTGNGEKSFVAGADIKEFERLKPEEAQKLAGRGQDVLRKIELLKIPVIAAVNGFALGGGLELALACDFIICHNRARFGLPEVSLGIMPGFGGTQRLAQAVGLRMAREMTYSGRHYDALAAKEMGLVNRVVEPEMLMEACLEVAGHILKKAPLAVAQAKRTILHGCDGPLEDGLELEARNFGDLFMTEDAAEGIAAFIEKREPRFVGK